MPQDLLVDPEALRAEVRDKYREVAVAPAGAPRGRLALDTVEFGEGWAEALPAPAGGAAAVIPNGATTLSADKRAVFAGTPRALRPGGVLQFAEIANGGPIPAEALRDVDLW